MTLTDEQYAEAIAAVKRGTYSGIIYIDRRCDGCDGSTACAVQAESGRRHKDELAWCSAGHGHWRRGYNVDAGEVMRRLLDENERLRAALGEAEYAVTTLRAEMQRLVDWAEAETANNEPEDPAHPHRAHSRVRAARSVLKGTGKP